MSASLTFTRQDAFPPDVGFSSGLPSRIRASAPVTNTVASEVPLLEYHRLSFPVLMMNSSGATTSGLRWGDSRGSPFLSKGAPEDELAQRVLPCVVAPTEIAS